MSAWEEYEKAAQRVMVCLTEAQQFAVRGDQWAAGYNVECAAVYATLALAHATAAAVRPTDD